jgi:hypothetical protein
MPGRTPSGAVAAFLEPLRDALKVLDGAANISVNPKGGFRKDFRYLWVLNGAEGMPLRPVGTLFAQMAFEVVDTDPKDNEYGHPFRVSTRGYWYKLQGFDGKDLWRMHWHPGGNSPVEFRHLHLPPDYKHLITDRMTWEQCILWTATAEAPLTCSVEEAHDRLALTEVEHKLYKSW